MCVWSLIRNCSFRFGLFYIWTCSAESDYLEGPMGNDRYNRVPDLSVAVCNRHGFMVWIWAGTGLPGKIPVVEKKDFMFSAITEEFGIIFAVALILICLNNLILMMNIASRCKTLFLQACSSSRIGCDLWVSGIFDRGRCYEDDTYDRCNYAVCQLWR